MTIPLAETPTDLQLAGLFKQAKVVEDGSGILTVEGWLVTYGERNMNGWLLAPGAFKAWSEKHPNAERPLPMLAGHRDPIGRWTQTKDSRDGNHARGRISDTEQGRTTATLLQDEALNGISVGFDADWQQIIFLNPEAEVTIDTPYGEFTYKADDWTVVFPECVMLEASIVAVPADDDARVDRLMQSVSTRARQAMPGLREDAGWDDAAYSMALLMGGRGAGQAFEDVDEVQRLAFYRKLSSRYDELGKTPPPYERHPVYRDIAFRQDEREIFADRYLRKGLATVVAGANGFQGQLSQETRDEADRALEALTGLISQSTDSDGIAETIGGLTERVRAIPTSRED